MGYKITQEINNDTINYVHLHIFINYFRIYILKCIYKDAPLPILESKVPFVVPLVSAYYGGNYLNHTEWSFKLPTVPCSQKVCHYCVL